MRILLLSLLLISTTASAHILIGSIVSSRKEKSIALFQLEPSQTLTHVRVGYRLEGDWYIREISYNKVVACRGIDNECQTYRPGENGEDTSSLNVAHDSGFQFNEDKTIINVQKTLKERLVTKDLAVVIMQAASRPVYNPPPINTLMGIELLEIDPGSVYDAFGLQDGDIIIKLDGVPVTNVVSTVKQLKGLQNAESFNFTILRNNMEKTITVNIEE